LKSVDAHGLGDALHLPLDGCKAGLRGVVPLEKPVPPVVRMRYSLRACSVLLRSRTGVAAIRLKGAVSDVVVSIPRKYI
jgi:hypothetical protein